jgi:ATP-dependent helicase/nuclease subunit B
VPPHIYTIAPDRPFLATLATGMLALAGGDPLALPRMTVLLPTRRAARALREAFLRLTALGSDPGAPLLLPRLRPIGDLDDDEIALGLGIGDGSDDASLAVPPAIPELRRRLLLTRLVLRWSEVSGEGPLLPGQAAALAAALARLLDMAQSEEKSFAGLEHLVPDEYAAHWQKVLQFLRILPNAWPDILAAEGALDAAERRNRLLRRQAAQWRASPPAGPVIAAGLMGGLPALVDLLSAVAWLDEGAVILPGFDRASDDATLEIVADEATHPQHLMARLLQSLDIMPEDVRDWPSGAAPPSLHLEPSPVIAGQLHLPRQLPPPRWRRAGVGVMLPRSSGAITPSQPSPIEGEGSDAIALPVKGEGAGLQRRLFLAAEALRPATMTDMWRDLLPEPEDALAGLARYDCASPQDEAVTAALLLRRSLETPGMTAALVTPDRELARRVAAELRRLHIDTDDSAGVPLARTPPGVFLRLVLDLADSALAPVPLLAALKHPLAAGGLAPEAFRDAARQLEQAIRGPRPAPGFAGLRAALKGKRDLGAFIDRLERCLARLAELIDADSVPLADLVTAHVGAAERLAATDASTGVARLWHEAAGEAAARFCHELIAAAGDFPPLPGRHYPALFEALAGEVVVRPAYGRHPRLAIWGLVEARLQQADLVVLGGLNEGTWPGPAAYDPWMSRQMRRDFGIAVPERAIGIAAHDFAHALGAPNVALTRATRRDGVPTVPSRWLLRLDTVLRAVGLDGKLVPDPEIAAAASLPDQPLRTPSPLCLPCPPLTARPRQLPVTQIETWIRDPYAIYARHILNLRALDELDVDPGRADLGIAVHHALAKFIARHPRELPLFAEDELLAIGRDAFGPVLSRPGVWAFWWPRFERVARWFVAEERARRSGEIVESASERNGRLVLWAAGGPFTITAIADRIDRRTDGGLALIDYKTGALPSKAEINNAVAVQLPLEAAIARDGSFGWLDKGETISGCVGSLEHWRLPGGDPAGERKAVVDGDPMPLVEHVLDQVRRLIDRFDDPATPYPPVPEPRWRPRFSDYADLERLDEAEAEPEPETPEEAP